MSDEELTGPLSLSAASAAAPRKRGHPRNPLRHEPGLLRFYARPQHMPVLFSRDLIEELERRWPREFRRTRANRLRLGDEIELNFFSHHYLRVSRFPVVPVPSSRVEFLFAHRCAKAEGASRCRKLLRSTWSDFVTFNDDATKRETLEKGLAVLHRLLREQFGTF